MNSINPTNPHPEPSSPRRNCLCVDLDRIGYQDAWTLQTELVAARWEKRLGTDVVLLLEHPPVFTLGRRGGRENLTVSEEMLTDRGIPVIQAERGGDITFHGPGQLVMYPIMDLTSVRVGVVEYVEMLEEVVIRVAQNWGITAGRNPLNRGVWIGNSKLASIGIAVRHGISFHGIALNVNLSLDPFSWINPCGLKGIGITSMEKELGRSLSMEDVRQNLKHHLEEIFGIKLIMTKIEDLEIRWPFKAADAFLKRERQSV